ncbi:sulfur carrier protein ThiS [Fulvivirga sp. M361]|nr:sulfur carrier protein ThiS [Fulvivirga sp. M361]
MDVSVNHESYQLDETINLQRLIERLDLSESGIAIAINNVIINRSDWRQTQLSDRDNILIIQAVQGG